MLQNFCLAAPYLYSYPWWSRHLNNIAELTSQQQSNPRMNAHRSLSQCGRWQLHKFRNNSITASRIEVLCRWREDHRPFLLNCRPFQFAFEFPRRPLWRCGCHRETPSHPILDFTPVKCQYRSNHKSKVWSMEIVFTTDRPNIPIV